MTQEGAKRAASSASNFGLLLGVILIITGLAQLPSAFMSGGVEAVNLVIGVVLIVIGVVIAVRAYAKGQRAAWLRANGLALTARILSAQPTGTTINDVPVYRFALEVAGPQGAYAASFEKLVPEHQVAMLIGGEVRVRANPGNLGEIIHED